MESNKILEIKCDCLSQYSLAMHQNNIPLIRSLKISNLSNSELCGLNIELRFSPEFAVLYTADGISILPGETVEITPIKIVMQPEYLSTLTERITGMIKITVSASDNEVLGTLSQETVILSIDQWTGTSVMPELTAAYITPNHPAVMQIVNKAAHHLMKWCGDPSFTGYQTKDCNRVKIQLAALYAALQEENIAYTMPPASFEVTGQRVRLPHFVTKQKAGTCLDLALLFASCAEAVGINPMIVFTKDHAFTGCWLEDETFASYIIDDPAALSKRSADGINSICLVECTDFTLGRSADFDKAVSDANEKIKNSEEFSLAIDIKKCRVNGIRPLPLTADGSYDFESFGRRNTDEITDSPSYIDPMSQRTVTSDNPLATKQMIWERKLLDLSLRNSLINFNCGSSSIQLLTNDLCKLEDELARGEDFKIFPAPEEIHISVRDTKIYQAENSTELIESISEKEFANRIVRTYLGKDELDAMLKKLHRKAKSSMEENGANTLYLALGLLCWYETEKSTKKRYAPLVLVPVDIIRRISGREYSLHIRNEDTQMNITLLEMLRQDFGIRIDGLDPLPQDESGVDIRAVFNTMRHAVMQQPRWDIEELAFIGQFSFGRFIMWNDIRNRCDELKNNKIVSSLINGRLEWEPMNIEISPSQIDAGFDPVDIAVPTSADSSQLAAVIAASEGESFVLHGPPGTGKSQTITNMIANALYHGKSVLFVAEKMAALSVVQARLKKLGLDPFCLELHSNKAQKRSVLSQLETAIETAKTSSPQEFEATANELKAERIKLSTFASSIHKKRSIGLSVYEAITVYDQNKQYDGIIVLNKDYETNVTAESYNNTVKLLERISAAGKELGGFNKSPLRYYRRTDHTFELKNAFLADMRDYSEKVRVSQSVYEKLMQSMRLPSLTRYEQFVSVNELMSLAVKGQYLTNALRGGTPVTDDPASLDTFLSKIQAKINISAEFLAAFDAGILTVNAEEMRLAWKTNEQKWFIGKALGRKKLLKALRALAKSPDNVTEDTFTNICDRLAEYQHLKAETDASASLFVPALEGVWQGDSTDFAKLTAYRANTVRMNGMLRQLEEDTLFAAVGNALSHQGDITALSLAFNALTSAQSKLVSEYKIDLREIFSAENWFEKALVISEDMISGAGLLRERSVLEGLLLQLDGLGASEVTEAFRNGKVTEDNIEKAFICSAAKMTIISAMSDEPQLSSFQGTQFEVTLAQYRNTVEEYRRLTVRELIARLSSKIPSSGEGLRQGESETAILRKAIKSGGRGVSIRSLFENIPTLLRRIAPCMLMSPISVAQYIDPKFPKFDIVIFDEASQLPTSEAVGAIARGDNVVVVGDPRQLPPTSFFSVQHTDEDNIDKEDLESVLDDCLALSMPQKHLLWHYRSRHESLIAFSNSRFYDNKLLTFPSPDDSIRKVTRVKVEGVYDKSGTRQNRAEAEAVVAEIVNRLSDPVLRKQSIGVVTFSSVQQNLIDDLLAEAYVKDPKLEEIADKMYEPIFIKNLENVQGDERDVILFSIGYGPDKNGKVSMNFGPLNQDGGWRRLNVAVSRARHEMKVFSVLSSDQIDLSRTQAQGVAELKYFLEFADRGSSALTRNISDTVYEKDGFAEIIADELSKRGYEARCGVGCSGFRVDVGVIDPENKDEFILGIMLESAQNCVSSSTDDLRITQPSVLGGLGWHIYNIHILDWLDNPESVMDKLLACLEEKKYEQEPDDTQEENSPEPVVYASMPISQGENEDKLTPFKPCILPIMGDAESFILPVNKKKIVVAISKVIEAEAPVSIGSLTKTVLSAWGISRKSKAVVSAFESALASVEHSTTDNGNMIWRADQSPEIYNEFRTGTGSSKRRIEDICTEELCSAVIYVLKSQISVPRNDLMLAVARLFGYTRASSVEEYIDKAIELAVIRGLVLLSDDKVTIKD